MKILFAGLVVMAAVSGCNQSTPGGPGTAERSWSSSASPNCSCSKKSG